MCSRDVDAQDYGFGIVGITKIGFVGRGQHYDENEEFNNKYDDSYNSSMDAVWESISIVCNCIRQCSFEGSTRKATAEKGRISGGGFLSMWLNSGKNPPPETINMIV